MKSNLKATLIYLLFLAGIAYLVFVHYKELYNSHIEATRNSQIAAIHSATNAYKILADTIFTEIVSTEDVLSLVESIVKSNGEKRDLQRGLLYRELAPVYERLRKKYLRQLHFHFPDGHSMLRFHSPSKSGDPLFQVRPSVKITNTQLRVVHGYESGRVFHGYRHVYPLIFNNKHLGSIEISTSFFFIRDELKEVESTNKTSLELMLYKPEFWNKVFPSLHSFYLPSKLHPDYARERADLISKQCIDHVISLPLIDKIKERLLQKPEVQKTLDQHQSCSFTVNYNYTAYSAIFHSVTNTIGEHAAYIVAISPEPFLGDLRKKALLRLSLYTALLTTIYILWLRFSALQIKQQQHALFLQSISDNMGIGLYTTDREGRVTFANSAALKMLKYANHEIDGIHAHNRLHAPDENNHERCLCDRAVNQGITVRTDRAVFRTSSSDTFPVEVVCTPLYIHKEVVGSTTVFQNISERLRQQNELLEAQKELRKMALQDSLTGLTNRRGFDQRAEKIWRNALRRKQPLSLLMIDIDHFKLYNDHYGHKQGDRCLERVAKTLDLACKRPEDLVARYGGEEFIALLPDTDLYSSKQVAKRMLAMVTDLKLEHVTTPVNALVTVSIGCCSIVPDTDKTFEELVICADSNLYQAKNSGRNRVYASDFTESDSVER